MVVLKFYLPLLLILWLWGWLFTPSLANLQQVWDSSETYMHCYLIPVISLWLLYDKRQQLRPLYRPDYLPHTPAPTWSHYLPLLALPFCLALWWLGQAADINSFIHFGTVVSLQLILLAYFGLTPRHPAWFAVIYLLFMIPFGDELNPMLQDITAYFSVLWLEWVGIPVYRDGLYIHTPVGMFEVAEACSGLRFLIASIAIGVLYAHLTFATLRKKVLFMLTLVVMSIFANSLRAFALIVIGELSQMRYGFGADHFVYGWLFFGAMMLLMFWWGDKYRDDLTPSVTHSASAVMHAANVDTATPLFQTSTPLQRSSVTSSTTAPQLATAHGIAILSAGLLLVTYLAAQQIVVTKAPAQPTSALDVRQFGIPTPNHDVVADFMPTNASTWSYRFEHSLALSHLANSQGIELLAVDYGLKQDKGELISWHNQIWHNTDLSQATLTMLGDQQVLTLDKTARSGQKVRLFVVYRIGSTTYTKPSMVKLQQALQFLTLAAPTTNSRVGDDHVQLRAMLIPKHPNGELMLNPQSLLSLWQQLLNAKETAT
jgi:exosortase A